MLISEIGLTQTINARIYEAPYHTNDSRTRKRWSVDGVPCFEDQILDFWRLYSTPLSDDDYISLSADEERDERARFIKNPITVASADGNVVGGVWTEPDGSPWKRKLNTGNGKTAHFHIKVDRENRACADKLLETYVKEFSQYSAYVCCWGKRNKIDDPTDFFIRNGFRVFEENYGRGKYAVYIPRADQVLLFSKKIPDEALYEHPSSQQILSL